MQEALKHKIRHSDVRELAYTGRWLQSVPNSLDKGNVVWRLKTGRQTCHSKSVLLAENGGLQTHPCVHRHLLMADDYGDVLIGK